MQLQFAKPLQKYSQSLCHERHGMRCDCKFYATLQRLVWASVNIRAYPPARSTHINPSFETPAVVRRNTLPSIYICRPTIHNYSQLKTRPAIDPARRHTTTLAPVRLQTNFLTVAAVAAKEIKSGWQQIRT